MKLPLYTIEGKKKGSVEVPDTLFATFAHPDLIHQRVVAARGSMRIPLAHTKDRSAVRGGGRKPWRQKGTGQARHGSTRSPIWKGGGVTFGPSNERVFHKDLPKKMKRKALLGVLSAKAGSGALYVIEHLAFSQTKTARGVLLLDALKLGNVRVLVWGSSEDGEFSRVLRNIPLVTSRRIESISVLDMLDHAVILISTSALHALIQTYGSSELVQQKAETAVPAKTAKRAKAK